MKPTGLQLVSLPIVSTDCSLQDYKSYLSCKYSLQTFIYTIPTFKAIVKLYILYKIEENKKKSVGNYLAETLLLW